MTNENTVDTTTKGKRKRATRLEMIARREAELAKLKAMESGDYSGDVQSLRAISLRKALKARKTALYRARVMLNGAPATDTAKAIDGIDAKIARTEERLAMQIETKRRSQDLDANLPFDIQRLEALVARVDAGETDVPFPTDLFPIADDQTNEQVEMKATLGD